MTIGPEPLRCVVIVFSLHPAFLAEEIIKMDCRRPGACDCSEETCDKSRRQNQVKVIRSGALRTSCCVKVRKEFMENSATFYLPFLHHAHVFFFACFLPRDHKLVIPSCPRCSSPFEPLLSHCYSSCIIRLTCFHGVAQNEHGAKQVATLPVSLQQIGKHLLLLVPRPHRLLRKPSILWGLLGVSSPAVTTPFTIPSRINDVEFQAFN